MVDRWARRGRAGRVAVVLSVTWVLSAAASAGCSAFATTDTSSPAPLADGAAPPASDGAVEDQGGADAGTGDVEVDAHAEPDGLLYTQGFEEGCGLFTFESVLSPSNIARTGTGACRVCAAPNASGYTIDTGNVGMGRSGETYRARAWVRTAPDSARANNISMKLRAVTTFDPFTVAAENVATGPELTDEWQEVSVTLEFPSDAALDFYVGANTPDPGTTCFLVDDLSLERVP